MTVIDLNYAKVCVRGARTGQRFIWLMICAVFICGNNEMSMFLWNLFLLTIIVARLWSGKTIPKWLVAVFAFSIVIGLIEVLAPGNFNRTTKFEKSGRPFRTLGNSILHYFIFTFRFLTLPLVVLIIAYHQKWRAWASQWMKEIEERKQKWIIFSFWYLLFFVTTAMAFWAMGRKPNSRSLNVVIYFYYLSLPFVLYLVGLWLKGRSWSKWTLIETKVKKHFVPLFILSFILSPTSLDIFRDYPKFLSYRKEWKERLAILEKSEGQDVELKRLQHRPHTTFFHEYHPGAPYVRKYYNLNSIKMVD